MANSCMLSRSTPPLDASFSSQKSFSNSACSLHVSLVPCSKFLGVALCNAPLPRSTSSPPSLVACSSSLPNLRSSQTRTQYVIKSIDETNHTSTFYTILKAHINMLICVNGIRNRSSSRESMNEALIYLFQMVCKTTKPGRKDEESSQEYGDRNVLEFLYSMFKEAIERGATVRSTHDAHGCSPSLIYGQSQANVKNNTTDDDSFIISTLCQTDGRYAVTSTLAGYTDIDAGKEKLNRQIIIFDGLQRWCCNVLFPTLISSTASSYILGPAHAEITTPEINMVYGELGAGVELGVQVLYLAALLGLVGVASYFVVKQVLIRRDLETAARDLQDRVRTGEALPVEYFELGAVMLRKKFYALASKYLELAIAKWDGDPQDLAQVHNALGFSYVSDEQVDRAIAEYQKAVKLQPGYVIAWNNLGAAYEKKKDLAKALEAYEQALLFDPNNAVAKEYFDALKDRLERLEGVQIKKSN